MDAIEAKIRQALLCFLALAGYGMLIGIVQGELKLTLHGFTAHFVDALIVGGVVDVGLLGRVDHTDMT